MGRDFNDLGYIEAVETGKTTIISIPVDLSGSTEAASQLNAFGTSPELDLAMGTLCFIAWIDAPCFIQGSNSAQFT